jgi:hypothetical protein
MNKKLLALAATFISLASMVLFLFYLLEKDTSVASVSAQVLSQAMPTVTGIEPATASNDIDTLVTITGTGFTVGLSDTVVITHPAVWLGNVPLSDATWVSNAQSSAPNATPPFNGWLVPAGGTAQIPYDTEISMDPSSSSFTLEGWVYNPFFPYNVDSRNLVHKSSSFLLETSTSKLAAYPIGTWTYKNFVSLLQCSGGVCTGPGHTISSCTSSIDNYCIPTGWFHFAYVYDKPSNHWMLFWNGTKYLDYVQTPNWSTQPIILSNAQKMDEFRISNNVRYPSNFTVPTGPFVCDANTLALWHFDEVQGATTFHDSCGATDNVMTGFNGAHTEGVTGYRVYLPLVIKQEN